MKIPDVNLLLYAVDQESPHHARALLWFEEAMSGTEPVGFAWIVLLAFIRLSTKAQIFARPFAPGEALDIVESWLAQPCAVVVGPTERHLAVLRGLIEPFGTAGNVTTDAHLAALAVEHGAEICSADTDFGRFPGVRWANPVGPAA